MPGDTVLCNPYADLAKGYKITFLHKFHADFFVCMFSEKNQKTVAEHFLNSCVQTE